MRYPKEAMQDVVKPSGNHPSQKIARTKAAPRSLLIFRVGVASLAVDAHSVIEVAELGLITAVPKLPQYLPGLVFLRGHAIPVLDLAAFLEIECPPHPEDDLRPPRIVVLSHEKMRVGIVSDQVRGIMQRRGADLKAPETLPQPLRDFSEAQIQDHEEVLAVLDLEHLLQEAQPRATHR